MALLQQANSRMKKATKDLELNMEAKLKVFVTDQIALHKDAKKTTKGLLDSLMAIEIKLFTLSFRCSQLFRTGIR